MLHDAMHDNLTGLPNRELFFDRLASALISRSKPGASAPAVLVDRHRPLQGRSTIPSAFRSAIRPCWPSRAASSRDLKPGDTLARLVGGPVRRHRDDRRPRRRSAATSKRCATALAAPISFGEREIALTVSIGAALYDPKLHVKGGELLADAQLALANAKKTGGDRAELFAPAMRTHALRPAIARERHAPRARARRDHGSVPPDRAAGGSDRRRVPGAVRWRHPRLGVLRRG